MTQTQVADVNMMDALGERYLSYALSTIVQRSLPDVRDGLKPVHRRLMYAMRILKLNPTTGYKKCARVVGDVIGKYHPHGEQSIYDAMVRLAQDFAVRYPLVDGQGNFGNIDGDMAAAMRYTEARLTQVATFLMDGLDENAIDFKATYDGETDEPMVMPSAFPNLLANGSSGIAVGMATNIPPHNAAEVCDALIHLVKYPEATVARLVKYVQGPDFPTGGVIAESPENILKAYETGRGSFRIRARYEVEKLEFGQYQVVVTEIPYLVQKSKLVEKIADAMFEKKLPLLGDMRDESDENVRIVFEPKSRTVDPKVLMESLFRHSDLDVRFSLNMNVVDAKGVPGVMSLRQVLQSFLDHRFEVLTRRSQHRLDKINRRLEILDGLLVAYLNIDEVIRIIREEDDPAAVMQAKWDLTEIQVEAILNMRLRYLKRLEEMEIRGEHSSFSEEKEGLEELLGSQELQQNRIIEELKEVKTAFGPKTELGKRRTTIEGAPEEVVVPIDAIVEREPVTIVCSKKGWIRTLKGHGVKVADIKYKEGDGERFVMPAETTDKVLIMTTTGKFYTVGVDKLPGGRGHGEPIGLIAPLDKDEKVVQLILHNPAAEDVKVLLASSDGRGFVTNRSQLLAQTKNGRQVLNVAKGAQAKLCIPVTGDTVAVVGQNRKLLVFKADEIPEMTRGRGVILQKYKDGGLSDVTFFTYEEGLSWKSGERTRTETNLLPWLGKRAQAGKLPPVGFPRDNKFTPV